MPEAAEDSEKFLSQPVGRHERLIIKTVATQNSELSASDQGVWVRHRPTGGRHVTEIKATAAYDSKLIKPSCSRRSDGAP